MKSRVPTLLLTLSLAGCAGVTSPTEPAPVRAAAGTGCPMSERDAYGQCIPPQPPPPCRLRDSQGRPYPGCVRPEGAR